MYISLTPADKWDNNNVSGGDLTEYNDQLLEHEYSLSPHPHHRHQCEVVDQNRHSHADSVHLCSVNTTYKDGQHEK